MRVDPQAVELAPSRSRINSRQVASGPGIAPEMGELATEHSWALWELRSTTTCK